MGLGLQWGAGNAGAFDTLDRLMAQRRADAILAKQAQQQEFNNQHVMHGDAMQEAELAQRAEANKAAMARQTGLDAEAKQQHAYTEANTLADQIPPGQFMGPLDPAVGRLQTGGRGSLLSDAPARPAMGPAFTGPMPGDAAGPETPQQAQVGRGQGFIKTASQKQIDTNTDNDRQAAADRERNRHDLAMENKPQHEPTNSFQLQPEIDPETGKQTGRFLGYNTKANRWEPVQGQGPQATKPAPGAAAAAQEKRTTGEALDTLSQLDQAIENARSLVGPGAGQISSLEQMAGAADPRIQALGVKMKAAKMRVDHAITGSVRAGASPSLLQQWDNILANKVDPDGLKAGVQAMREILGGQAQTAGPAAPAGAGGAPPAPAGWTYVPKPGGGWTAVEAK